MQTSTFHRGNDVFVDVLIAWLASVFFLIAPAEAETNANTETWIYTVFIRHAQTPVYAKPSADAEVIYRYEDKGQAVNFTVKVEKERTPKIRPWDNKEWISHGGEKEHQAPSGVPPGWLRRQDILTSDDFKKVTQWPIRYFLIQAEFYQEVYVFKPDGRATYFHYNEKTPQGKFITNSHVYIVEGVVALNSGADSPPAKRLMSNALGIYDEKGQCVLPLYNKFKLSCERARDPKYIAGAVDYAQALFADPPKPLYLDGVCAADCEEKKNTP